MKTFKYVLKFCVLYLLVICPSLAVIDNNDSTHLGLLDSVLTNNNDILKTDFKMVRHLSETQELQSSGKSYITNNNGICWITENPIKKLLYISPSNEVFNSYIDKSDVANPMRHSGNKNNSFILGFSQILHGDIKQNSDNYKLTFETTNEKIKTIIMEPKDKNIRQAIKNIVISLSENLITKVKIEETTGNYTLIEFSNSSIIDGNNIGMRELCNE